MKNEFADYQTSMNLKSLGFDERCMGLYGEGGFNCGMIKNSKNSNWQNPVCTAPLWQQAEEWIFNKHQIYISAVGTDLSKTTETTGGWYCELHQLGGIKRETYLFDGIKVCGYFNSPIIAKIEGIRKTIELLYSQTAVAVTPINTNANGA